ncbi:MAG TPA: glycosyl transferase [Silvibacterium sp.]|nr:glycosyl transferase [Silvibacterium sp.]
MAHLAFLSLNALGHMYPMSSLALHMEKHGHTATFFSIADMEAFLQEAGLKSVVIGRESFPIGYTPRVFGELGKLKGQAGVRHTVKLLTDQVDMHFAELPAALRSHGVDLLVIDQLFMGGGTVGDHLRLPYVHVANALLSNREVRVPPMIFGWGFNTGPLALMRNRLAYAAIDKMLTPLRSKMDTKRQAWGLPPYRDFPNDVFSARPQICQQPPSFEYDRRSLPPDFHFVGPLHSPTNRVEVPLPWERLDGRRLIYAPMGTLQNGMDWVFRTIIEACAGVDAQLVLSLGGNMDPSAFPAPNGAVVIRFARHSSHCSRKLRSASLTPA